jgi:predicted ester cyclase
MATETHKALIRRLVEDSFNQKNLNLLDMLVDEHYIDHAPFPDQAPGVEGMKQAHLIFYQGFPDVQQTIDDLIAEGDRVVVRWTCFGPTTACSLAFRRRAGVFLSQVLISFTLRTVR